MLEATINTAATTGCKRTGGERHAGHVVEECRSRFLRTAQRLHN